MAHNRGTLCCCVPSAFKGSSLTSVYRIVFHSAKDVLQILYSLARCGMERDGLGKQVYREKAIF